MAIFRGNNVDFHEAMEGSGGGNVSSNAQTYQAIWKVAWADVERAKVFLLGRTTARAAVAILSAPAYFSRALPHALPRAPWLYCTEIVRTEGKLPRGRDDNDMVQYEWAYLYCNYTKMNCNVLSDGEVLGDGGVPDEFLLRRFVRKRRSPNVHYMTSRLGGWRWLDRDPTQNNSVVAMEIPYRIPKVRLLYTWLRIPIANLNEPYINDTIGTCHGFDGPGDTGFGGLGGQSLLLNSVQYPDWNPIPGQDGFQVDVTFDITYFGWQLGPNFFPDPQRANTFHEVGTFTAVAGPGPPFPRGILHTPFPVRDWRPMFRPINV